MLSGSENSGVGQLCGSAMMTLPATESTSSAASFKSFPSSTLRMLNSGMSSRCGSLIVSILYAAMSPAERVPNRLPSELRTGMTEIFCSFIMCHALSIVTLESSTGGVSKSRSRTCVRTSFINLGGLKPNLSSIRCVSSLI